MGGYGSLTRAVKHVTTSGEGSASVNGSAGESDRADGLAEGRKIEGATAYSQSSGISKAIGCCEQQGASGNRRSASEGVGRIEDRGARTGAHEGTRGAGHDAGVGEEVASVVVGRRLACSDVDRVGDVQVGKGLQGRAVTRNDHRTGAERVAVTDGQGAGVQRGTAAVGIAGGQRKCSCTGFDECSRSANHSGIGQGEGPGIDSAVGGKGDVVPDVQVGQRLQCRAVAREGKCAAAERVAVANGDSAGIQRRATRVAVAGAQHRCSCPRLGERSCSADDAGVGQGECSGIDSAIGGKGDVVPDVQVGQRLQGRAVTREGECAAAKCVAVADRQGAGVQGRPLGIGVGRSEGLRAGAVLNQGDRVGDRSREGTRAVVVTDAEVVGARTVDDVAAAAERINGGVIGAQVEFSTALDGDRDRAGSQGVGVTVDQGGIGEDVDVFREAGIVPREIECPGTHGERVAGNRVGNGPTEGEAVVTPVGGEEIGRCAVGRGISEHEVVGNGHIAGCVVRPTVAGEEPEGGGAAVGGAERTRHLEPV